MGTYPFRHRQIIFSTFAFACEDFPHASLMYNPYCVVVVFRPNIRTVGIYAFYYVTCGELFHFSASSAASFLASSTAQRIQIFFGFVGAVGLCPIALPQIQQAVFTSSGKLRQSSQLAQRQKSASSDSLGLAILTGTQTRRGNCPPNNILPSIPPFPLLKVYASLELNGYPSLTFLHDKFPRRPSSFCPTCHYILLQL